MYIHNCVCLCRYACIDDTSYSSGICVETSANIYQSFDAKSENLEMNLCQKNKEPDILVAGSAGSHQRGGLR